MVYLFSKVQERVNSMGAWLEVYGEPYGPSFVWRWPWLAFMTFIHINDQGVKDDSGLNNMEIILSLCIKCTVLRTTT